jgi:hypothetical protein
VTTPDTPFRRPEVAAGDKWNVKEEGPKWLATQSLFLFYPKEIKQEFDTGKYKPTDVVVADVIAVTGPDAGKAWINTFIFSKGIVAILKDKLGDPVPGIFSQRQYAEGLGWTLLDEPWDQIIAAVTPVHQKYLAGQFKKPDAPAAAGVAAGVPNQWGAPPQEDPWAGVNAAPAAPQQGWGAPPPAAPPAQAPAAAPPSTPSAPPASAADPNVGLLISKGLDPQQVLGMDPATRAAIAATY